MASLMDRVYGTPMGDPSDIATHRCTMEPHDSLKNSNAKSHPSALDKNSLSPGNNFRSSTLTTSQPPQLDLHGDASNSSYCEECFYCPECSDHSDCESCVDCEICVECDDCDIMMEKTRRYMGELDGMMHHNNTTPPNSALLQHSGDDGWMDFVNIPQDADATGDQNSAANDAQDASTTVQTGLPVLDDNSPSNISTGFPTAEEYAEASIEYYFTAERLAEVEIPNPSDLFGVGQQFDEIPSNYGDKASISESPTLAVDDDALFRHIFQVAGIMNAATVGDAEMPAMQSPLPAYLPAQAMPVAYPADNSLAPTVDRYGGIVPQDAIRDNTSNGNWQAPPSVHSAPPYNPGAVRDPYAENLYAANVTKDFLAATMSLPPPPPPPPGFAFQAAPSTSTMVVRNIYARTIMVANPLNSDHRPTVATRPAARLARRKKTPSDCPLAKKTCAYCPDKGPFDASGLAKHNNSLEHQKARGAAIPTKKYACPYCKKRFPRQDHIKRHILKVIKAANDDANGNVVVVPPKCPVLQKKDADGEQGVWEWELEANGSYSLLKDRNERNPFMMPVGYKARMKQTYGGRHGQ